MSPVESTPQVSIVIPAYNAGRFISEALESVLRQTYSDFEILIVDDGSTDDTAEQLRPYRSRLNYVKQSNAGPAVARNRAILGARGRYIAFLDADDMWAPTKLEKQVAYLEQHPEAVLVYTDFNRSEHPGTSQESSLSQMKSSGTGPVFYRLLQQNFIATTSVMVRRESLSLSGIFDPTLKGPEDFDLWLRLSKVGDFGCINEVLVYYRHHDGNLFQTTAFNYEIIRAQRLILARWGADAKATRIIRTNLGQCCWELAYTLWQSGNFREARSAYLKSALYGRYLAGSLSRAAACCLPAVLLSRLRDARALRAESGSV